MAMGLVVGILVDTAARSWELLSGSGEDIGAGLVADYDVNQTRARRDVNALIASLETERLITRAGRSE